MPPRSDRFIPQPLAERWAAKVARTEGCWTWRGATNGTAGYGRIHLGMGTRRREYAHRVSYRLHIGPIPNGYDIDHLCRNPICVRPEHLEAVPHRENMGRSPTIGRFDRGPLCKWGHALNERRKCRICVNRRAREYRARRTASSE